MDVVGMLQAIGPEAGFGTLLLLLLVYVWRNSTTDRTSYADTLAAAEARHAAELQRVNEAHDAEIRELRGRLDAQEVKTAELAALFDEERRKRWHAEDAAAQAKREAGNA